MAAPLPIDDEDEDEEAAGGEEEDSSDSSYSSTLKRCLKDWRACKRSSATMDAVAGSGRALREDAEESEAGGGGGADAPDPDPDAETPIADARAAFPRPLATCRWKSLAES